MAAIRELLTPSEAAVVAGVSVRDVNRVIDEHIVPEALYSLKGGRWLKSQACAYVRFYFHTAKALTSDERTRVIRTLSAMKKRSWTFHQDFLTVKLDGFFEETEARRAALLRARALVVEDPEILGGTPVIRGTRIPVYDVAASMRAGDDPERLKAAYPGLEDEHLELAGLYAQASPARGRPRGRSAPADLRMVSGRKVARRRRA
ncbi:MAG TPA: DUF433 domain-containing protein [Phenylobacterium sp.]